MLKSARNACFTAEQLPALGVFGTVRVQPLEAPPTFGAVVAKPEDFKRLSGSADADASDDSVVIDRCGTP
jgi:hypothetical protein